VVIWKHLSHPNVLPFVGAAMVIGVGPEKYEIVSELMKNGNINAFIKRNGDVNRLELVGFNSSHWFY
jgi:altronate dehydratase